MSTNTMDGASTTAVTVPTTGRKKIYLIRHAQSTYNASARKGYDPMLFDARLSELGITQAEELANNITKLPSIPQLIVSTPMSRALHTTKRGILEYAKCNNIPVMVSPLHHEFVRTSDDNGRPKSLVAKDYPEFDLSQLEERWWWLPANIKDDFSIDTEEYFKTVGYQESEEHLMTRISKFKEWINQRPETVMVFVGHSDFFYHLFEKKLPYFKNCQIVEWYPDTMESVNITN
ncbi:hypothetical protein CYY_005949 [Polysphondylium violaceum]|uniref:Phosphoglycerate mutase family protein n=1 Tax=Polysphondylium violaceum TaxID=133409 RepID=A0A8J4UZA4_9MYCE|nr:hypothetical protein CYY_005949 [Polysphondylium violaceum]